MEITLKLTPEEVNQILAGLSALPTSTGVYPLAIRIKEEAEAQLQKPEELK